MDDTARQIDDVRAEADELHRLLDGLGPEDWARPTLFKGWTVDDILQHLHVGDTMGLASIAGPAVFDALVADIAAKRSGGLSRVQETRQRLHGLVGARLLDRWHSRLHLLCGALAALGPQARLKWAGPDMGVRMFATARQMEIWSHGQAIYDLFAVDRPAASPRLRNIAEIGVRTYGWAWRNRGLEPPPDRPAVRLRAPAGEVWEWDGAGPAGEVAGEAVEFCQVVTQTRHFADTGLQPVGDTARRWMAIAQCFAGPPEEPPAPGIRRKAAAPPR